LRIAFPDQPRRLDPAYSKDLYEGIASGLLYDGLLGYGKGAEVEPRLASHFSASPDGTSYTFHLRPGVRFHDGKLLTSADVRFSFERVLHPSTASDRRWVLDRIAGSDSFTSGLTASLSGLQTPDSQTVVLNLTRPSPVFLSMLAMPAASIVPLNSTDQPTSPSTAGTALDRAPVGTGPWKLAEWQRDRRLVLERHPQFWGTPPAFDRLIWLVLADDTVRRTAFQQGQLDLIEVGFQEWDTIRNDPKLGSELLPNQELRTDFIGLGCSRPATGDPRVRLALRLALDSRMVFERIQKSRGVPASGVVPPLSGWPSPAPLSPQPAQARALLAEAGYSPERPLQISLWYRELALNGEIVASVKQAWEAVGVKVELIARDQAAFRAAIWAGKPDAFLGSWTLDYPDPENALVPPFHSRNIPRQGNQVQLRDDGLDQLLNAAQTELQPDRRRQLFQQAEARVMELTPWIPLFHRRTYHLRGPRLGQWTPKLMYNADRFLDARPVAIPPR
jgi:ABC-type transport system substrate-binding protein